MDRQSDFVTVAEAAVILGRSKSAIYKALNSSPPRLVYADRGKGLLCRQDLERHFATHTRPRIDKPMLALPSGPVDSRFVCKDEWNQVAEIANRMLDVGAWSAPPWDGCRWAVICGVIDMARSEVF